MFWNQEHKVEKLVRQHLEMVDQTLRSFQTALEAYLKGDGEVTELAAKVHQWESKADDVRREVTTQLLKGSLLGSFRGDMLRLIEDMDKLANTADALMSSLILQNIQIPTSLYPRINAICEKSIEILDELNPAIELLFSNMPEVLTHTRQIEKLEGEIDDLEKASIRDVFLMELSLAEKLWVRDFISHLAQLSDRAEDLSDLIEIIVAKRRA